MYPVDKIIELRNRALELELFGAELLLDCLPETLQTVCNGIGPDWMAQPLRDAAGKLAPELEPVAMIHDLRYQNGGNFFDRLDADSEFRDNGFRVADTFAWYQLRRYRIRRRTRAFYTALRIFGKSAWNDKEA